MMEKVIYGADLFCGAGGSSTGLELACEEKGFKLKLLAINHWEVAIATHTINHPEANHLCENLDNVNPRKVVPDGYLDILVASPECFPAGTLILTDEGYLPIEEIKVGMRVLTHLNRWQKVTNVLKSVKSVSLIKGHGHPGMIVTPNHPFYIRQRKKYHRRPKGINYYFKVEDPKWVELDKIKPIKNLWATP